MFSYESLDSLRSHITDLIARPEFDAEHIHVQHLLVSFNLAGIPGISRSKEEAEAFTAKLWAEIQDGAKFDALVKKNTDDSHPGVYSMTTGKPSGGVYARSGMVPAFGNTGWRLEVGEVGVAGFDQASSPYGWHILCRLK